MRSIFPALGVKILCMLMLAASLCGPLWAFEIEEERLFSAPEGTATLRIISTTDTEIFAPLIEGYMNTHPGVSVHYVVAGSRDVYSALTDGQQGFDLAISSAMDLQMKLANDGLARPYRSDQTERLPNWAHWRDLLFAFAQEEVVLTVTKSGFAGLDVPRTRDELIATIRDNPARFQGRIGTYDPSLSGAGYLFATQDARQSDTFWRLSEVIGRVDPALYGSTGAMIEDLKTGKLIMAYNVLGSYVAGQLAQWPDGQIVEMRDFTHVLLRTALIPASAEAPDLGESFLDFLLSPTGQTMIATKAVLPRIDENALATQPHLRPIRLDPGLLVYVDPLKRRRFLTAWTAAIVQP